jgi:hypothetical protein
MAAGYGAHDRRFGLAMRAFLSPVDMLWTRM